MKSSVENQQLIKTSYHIAFYSAGNILLKFVGLLLVPLYTSVFSLSEFGIIGVIETTSLLLTTILSFNLSAALVRWLSDEKDITTEKSIVFTILSLNIFFITIFSLLTLPFLSIFPPQIGEGNEFGSQFSQNLLLLLFINTYIDIVNRIPLNLIRIREKPVLYIVSMTMRSIITLGTNIVLLKHTSLGILAVLWGGIAGNVAFFLCTTPLLIRNIYFKFLRSEVAGILKYSFPLIFVGLGSVLLNMGDRYVLTILKDLGQVGIYTMAFKVSSIVNMFVLQAVNFAIFPIALKSFDSENGKSFLRQIQKYLVVILCFMFLSISIFSMDFLKLFAKSNEYLLANSIIPILLFAYIFEGMRILFSYHILHTKKTQWNAYLTLSSTVLNIGLNLFAIPKFGYIGAAWTTLSTSLFTLIAYRMIAQKMIFVDYDDKKIFRTMIISLLCFSIFKTLQWCDIGNLYSSVLILLLFAALLFVFKSVNIKDFQKITKKY